MQTTLVSFFDDMQPLWRTEIPPQIEIEKETSMSTKSKKSGLWKNHTYNFSQKWMIQFSKLGIPKRCLSLENISLTCVTIPSDVKFGFHLKRHNASFDVYCGSEDKAAEIFAYMKYYAVQTCFHENYLLGKKIGQGSFAKVFIAKNTKENIEYAVKMFQKSSFTDLDIDKPSLIKEIQILRQVSHQGVIKLYEVYENENYIYLIKELLKGGELFKKLKKNTSYSERYAAQIMLRLLSSIEYVHSKNILHRDIKPENLILRSKYNDFDICLADFGLADYYDPEGQYMFKRCGTPGYVAPELLQDKIYNNKIDIFSCGTIMYLMLSGVQAFRGINYDAVVIKNYNCEIDFMDLDKKLTNQGYLLLRLLLNKNPKVRPTASEAIKHKWFDAVLGKEEISQTLKIQCELQRITTHENKYLYSITPLMGLGSLNTSSFSSLSPSASSNSMSPNTPRLSLLSPRAAKVSSANNLLTRSNSSVSQPYTITPRQVPYKHNNLQSPQMHPIAEEENVFEDRGTQAAVSKTKKRYSLMTKTPRKLYTNNDQSLKLPSIVYQLLIENQNSPKRGSNNNESLVQQLPKDFQLQIASNIRSALKTYQ